MGNYRHSGEAAFAGREVAEDRVESFGCHFRVLVDKKVRKWLQVKRCRVVLSNSKEKRVGIQGMDPKVN